MLNKEYDSMLQQRLPIDVFCTGKEDLKGFVFLFCCVIFVYFIIF